MSINSPQSPLCNLFDWMSHCICTSKLQTVLFTQSWDRAVCSSYSVSDLVQYIPHPVGMPDLLFRYRMILDARESGDTRQTQNISFVHQQPVDLVVAKGSVFKAHTQEFYSLTHKANLTACVQNGYLTYLRQVPILCQMTEYG